MATSDKPTNGERYDYERQTWVVQCGPNDVPIRKLDANGQPVPPPEEENESKS